MDLKGFDICGAIFDLDGTIADSLNVWEDIDIRFFGKRGLKKPENYQQSVQSMDFSKAAAYTKKLYGFNDSEEEIISEWHEMSIDEYANKIPLKPFAKEFIERLYKNGVKIALATASGRELFEPLLKRCEIYRYFSSFLTTKDVGKDKFSPDIYLKSAENIGVSPNKCMVFEDILPAIVCAKSKDFITCGVFDSHSNIDAKKIRDESNIYINSFKELF